MVGPWYFRFFLIFLFLVVARSLPSLGWIMIAIAVLIIVIKLLYEAKRFPEGLMDILDRLTNKSELDRRYKNQKEETVMIDAGELAQFMKTKIIGQDSVIDSVAQQLRYRFAARRPDKPVAVFCFAGPPGVGKTYFAKVLAEKLYGDQKYLLFYDMSLYSQPHAAASMFGQAKGYVGSNTYGSLTAGLRDFPRSVVLLDEFEKAHPEVHKRFLTAWNDGFVTEVSDGAKISTSETVFIITTNAASKKIRELTERYSADPRAFSEAVYKVLEEATFAPEVLSRIDNFFAFSSLKGLDVARVVALEIERTVHQYQLELADGGIDPEILLQALEQDGKFLGGVREMARMIEHRMADAIIQAKTAGAKKISLQYDKDKGITAKIITYRDSAGSGKESALQAGS